MKHRFSFWNHNFDLELEEEGREGPLQNFTYITLLAVFPMANEQADMKG